MKKKNQLVYNWIFIPVWNKCRNGYFKKSVEINRGSRIIKTNHMYLVYKTFQGRNLSKIFGGILENWWLMIHSDCIWLLGSLEHLLIFTAATSSTIFLYTNCADCVHWITLIGMSQCFFPSPCPVWIRFCQVNFYQKFPIFFGVENWHQFG